MKLIESIKNELEESQKVLNDFLANEAHLKMIEDIALTMVQCIKIGHKIISCGNGGSHCDAMHFAEEMTGRFRNNRPALPAIAISDASHLSCVANDFGYDEVFARYIEGLGKKNDILLAISTSGNSKNVIRAVQTARDKDIITVGLLGKDGGTLGSLVDKPLIVSHFGYADRIQEIHIKIIHILILMIEKELDKIGYIAKLF